MSNGIWIGDKDALTKEEWKKLTNEPGSIIKKNTGRDLHREAPPALPNYIMEAAKMMVDGLEKLSGITEVVEGRRPGQVTSGVALESLAIMAQTVIRLKARQLDNLIQRVGQKLIARIFQFYTTDRVFNFVGDGKIQNYLFEREKIRELIKKDGMKAFQDYQFKVVPTSSLAMTKWQKGLIATQLFQLGLIDNEATLEALEFPNREEIMQRMAQNPQGFARKSAPSKLPANLLRGGNKQTALQEFQR
jgi:hypothetical protein